LSIINFDDKDRSLPLDHLHEICHNFHNLKQFQTLSALLAKKHRSPTSTSSAPIRRTGFDVESLNHITPIPNHEAGQTGGPLPLDFA